MVNVSVYKREGDHLYVDMQTSVFGFKSRVFTKNIVRQAEGYMAWTLDYDRKSDVSDLVGYWRVVPVDPDVLGPLARKTAPVIEQWLVGGSQEGDAFEAALLRLRRRIGSRARHAWGFEASRNFYVA